jgi:hypothetical protein
VVLLLLTYTAIVMPFKMAFIDDDWFYLEITIDSFFFLDVILNLNTAIFNERG